jgi:hypothetical protein
MKGGVVRRSVNIREPNGNYFHDDRHACHYFLNNCTMQILSNSTISAITFRCTLNDGIVSPFVHVRSGLFNHPVRQLFLKCLPTWHHTEGDRGVEMKYVDNGRSGGPREGWGQIGQIEINNIKTVQEEAQMQHAIYCGTFNTQSHTCDPVCPSIISLKYIPKNRAVGVQSNQHTVEKMLDYIRVRLVPRDGLGRRDRFGRDQHATFDGDLQEIRDTFFMDEPNIGISIIIMELMDGYLPIPEYIGNDARRLNISNALAKFEFKRLARLGFRQTDLNQGNYMIHPTYDYIPNFPGRVILIDFGRAEQLATNNYQAEFTRLDRTFRTEPAAGTITGHTYDEIVALLQQKNDRIKEFLRANHIDLEQYVLSLRSRTIAGGATDISNENENDNEIIKQFLNNQPIDIIKQLLEMHKQRILKVGDLIDKFNESNIKKQLTPSNINKNVFTKLLLTDSNDKNMLTKKMNQNSIQNKTTKKQQSPLRNTIFNNLNNKSTRLMVAGKKAKPFSRTRKNKRT